MKWGVGEIERKVLSLKAELFFFFFVFITPSKIVLTSRSLRKALEGCQANVSVWLVTAFLHCHEQNLYAQETLQESDAMLFGS
jgi:hypothetical protein